MIQNNSTKEFIQCDYDEFIKPILMSLGMPTSKPKKAEKIEKDVQKILKLTYAEMHTFFDATPEITIMRSKVEYALYEMVKKELIKLKDETYSITKKGRQLLFL